MIRVLAILVALAALAVPATPALAGTSNFSSEPTAGGGRSGSAHVAISLGLDSDADGVSDSFETSSTAKRKGRSSPLPMYSYGGKPTAKYYLENAGPKSRSLSSRYSWRTPNPRREQEFQLIQAQLAEAGLDPESDVEIVQ